MKNLLVALVLGAMCQMSFGALPPRAVHYSIAALPTLDGARWSEYGKINKGGQITCIAPVAVKLGRDSYSDEHDHALLYRDNALIDLHLLIPGLSSNMNSYPIDINDQGQVLLRTDGQHSWDQFFIYDQGQFLDLNALLGRNDIDVWGFNNTGAFVGTAVDSNDIGQAFVYSGGQFKLFPLLPGAPQSTATAINDFGRAVGWAGWEDFREKDRSVVFRRDATFALVASPSYAVAINNHGDIATTRSLRRRDGRIISFPFTPSALNNRGQVVGSGPHGPMIYSVGSVQSLNHLIDPASGWVLDYVSDINDSGKIVGRGTLNGLPKSFLLTPVKRPTQ